MFVAGGGDGDGGDGDGRGLLELGQALMVHPEDAL